MSDADKIKPAAPKRKEGRRVDIPPTVGAKDTTSGDKLSRTKRRADFDANEFTRIIRQHGKFAVWRKCLICPCLDENKQPRLNCAVCNSSGFVYADPIQIQAHMASFDKDTKLYEKFGIWEQGAVSVTVEPKYRFGYRDSIELLDSLMVYTEVIVKGNRRGARSKLPDGVDSARFRIVNANRVVVIDNDNANVSILEHGIHFEITSEGWIKWTRAGDNKVADGSHVSIHYDFRPVYLVTSHPHVIRDDLSMDKTSTPTVKALPLQARAQLAFLLDINEPPDTTPGTVRPQEGS